LKDLIQGKNIKMTYYDRIKNLHFQDTNNFSLVLTQFFGSVPVKKIDAWITNEKWSEIEQHIAFLRHSLVITAIQKHPIRSFSGVLKFFFGHLYDYCMGRNRVFICFIGPDGSGKSTISSLVMDAMQDIFDDRKYFHAHFEILPPLSWLIPRRNSEDKSEKTKLTENVKIPSKFPTAVMVLYYSLEYILGFLLISIRRRKFNLVIFDRYFYDYAIQPSPFSSDCLFFKTLQIGLPKPDIVIFLKSPAEIIYQRKSELSIQELSRQIKICNHIMTQVQNPCIIENTQPKDLVVQIIRSKIIEIIQNRVRRIV
jgi:thymidylate kinase